MFINAAAPYLISKSKRYLCWRRCRLDIISDLETILFFIIYI